MKRGSRDRAMKTVIGCIALLAVVVLGGTLHAAEDGAAPSRPAEITGIEILDHAVKITVAGPLHYKVSKTDDPFRIAVDIEGAQLGKFKEPLLSKQQGITEVVPVQVENPPLARLVILMQTPSAVLSEVNGDVITVSFKAEPPTAANPAVKEAAATKTDDASDAPADEIIKVFFNKTAGGVELVVKGDGAMPDPEVFELDGKLIVDISGVKMAALLPKDLLAPVKGLRQRGEEGKVRLILELDRGARSEVIAVDDEVIIDLFRAGSSKSGAPGGAAAHPDHVRWAGTMKEGAKQISLDFQEADIIPILRLLGDVSGYNIVIHPDVKGKITMKLMNVPWEQALDIVLKTFGLEKVVEGNIIRVATLKAFQEEKKAIADTKEVFGKAEDIETRIFSLNYADAEKIREAIEKAKLMSPRGSISVDMRTRSVIVKDTPSGIQEIASLIETLDRATPQVLIEARIVEMNTNFARDIGVQWGFQWSPTLKDKGDVSVVGSATDTVFGGRSPGLITLPISPSSAASGGTAITLGYLSASQTFGLDLRLIAAENTGRAKIISSPKIMTLENEKAEIIHGTQIPVVTPGTRDTPPTVTYKDANLKLVVTPSVTPDSTVFLNMEITNDVPDFRPERAILGNVPIDKREAKNKVLVKNGETIVIGGILKAREDDAEDRVPGISRIPVLGRLFKRDLKKTDSQELVIFITPRIVK